MVAFMCSENRIPMFLGILDFLFQESEQRLGAHVGAVDDVAFVQGKVALENRCGSVLADELDLRLACGAGRNGHRLFVGEEVVFNPWWRRGSWKTAAIHPCGEGSSWRIP